MWAVLGHQVGSVASALPAQVSLRSLHTSWGTLPGLPVDLLPVLLLSLAQLGKCQGSSGTGPLDSALLIARAARSNLSTSSLQLHN